MPDKASAMHVDRATPDCLDLDVRSLDFPMAITWQQAAASFKLLAAHQKPPEAGATNGIGAGEVKGREHHGPGPAREPRGQDRHVWSRVSPLQVGDRIRPEKSEPKLWSVEYESKTDRDPLWLPTWLSLAHAPQ